jgi:hypothetical protein
MSGESGRQGVALLGELTNEVRAMKDAQKLKSSTIASASYDEETNILEIAFHSGSIYAYYDVSEEIYKKFLESASKGKFHAKHIKNAFEFKRIS